MQHADVLYAGAQTITLLLRPRPVATYAAWKPLGLKRIGLPEYIAGSILSLRTASIGTMVLFCFSIGRDLHRARLSGNLLNGADNNQRPAELVERKVIDWLISCDFACLRRSDLGLQPRIVTRDTKPAHYQVQKILISPALCPYHVTLHNCSAV